MSAAVRPAAAPATPAAAAGAPNKWTVLGVVSTGAFMTTLDGSIVNIGLPAIGRAFSTPLSGAVEWVIIGYLVVIAGTLLTFGRLSDLHGRPTVWRAGIALFTAGSALCGAAPTLGLLIAARAVQGVGASMVFAPSIALVTNAFPRAEQGRALGLNAVVVSLGTSVGPIVGGLLVERFAWRSIFYVNVPIGALVTLAAFRVLPRAAPPAAPAAAGGTAGGAARGFDPAGAGLLGGGLALLTLGLSFGAEWGWGASRTLGAVGAGLAALAAAAAVERRAASPVLDLALVRDRTVASALASLLVSVLALFAVGFMLPFYFEQLRGFSPERAGLLLTPLPLAMAAMAPVSGRLADRYSSRWLAAAGLAVAALGLALLARLDAASTPADVAWRLAVTGLGQGLFLSPNTRALMGAAPPAQQGSASGLLATARVVGQSVSVALLGAVFTSLGGSAAGATLGAAWQAGAQAGAQAGGPLGDAATLAAARDAFLHAFRAAVLASAALAAAGVATALVRGRGGAPAVTPQSS